MKRSRIRMKTGPYTGTQAVMRALSVLNLFTDERPSQTLAELSRKSGLNKTTTFRLLTALQSNGLVSRDPGTDSYALGSEIISLGGRALRANTLRAISQPILQSLVDLLQESASLEILIGQEVLILDEVFSGHLMGATQALGTRWPAFATSTGKAMAAHLSTEEQQEFLKGPFRKYTDRTITDPKALQREFHAILKRGYAIADESIELGFIALGAPVLNHDGRPVAAISIGGPRVRISPAKIPQFGMQLNAASLKISQQLGYRKP